MGRPGLRFGFAGCSVRRPQRAEGQPDTPEEQQEAAVSDAAEAGIGRVRADVRPVLPFPAHTGLEINPRPYTTNENLSS